MPYILVLGHPHPKCQSPTMDLSGISGDLTCPGTTKGRDRYCTSRVNTLRDCPLDGIRDYDPPCHILPPLWKLGSILFLAYTLIDCSQSIYPHLRMDRTITPIQGVVSDAALEWAGMLPIFHLCC